MSLKNAAKGAAELPITNPNEHFDSGMAILFEKLKNASKNLEKLLGKNNRHIVRNLCLVAMAK